MKYGEKYTVNFGTNFGSMEVYCVQGKNKFWDRVKLAWKVLRKK